MNIEDSILIRRIQNGDLEAFETLVRKHYQNIYQFCVRRCNGDTALAADLTQDTFLKLVEDALPYGDYKLEAAKSGIDMSSGEGRIDGQSVLFGKAASGVAAQAGRVPVVALVGGVGPGGEAFEAEQSRWIVPIADGPLSLEQSMRDAERLVSAAARRLFGVVKMGMDML